MAIAPQKEKPPNPLAYRQFWMLIGTTFRMKLIHRIRGKIRGEGEYTDHLRNFYTRSKTKNVEVYGDAYADVRPIVIELADPKPGDFVLDVATGGGYQAAAFAEAGYNVVGLDYVQDRARLALEQHGNHNITWGSADMSRLPFKTNSVDILTITFALHDLPLEIQMKGLAEMRRVARKRVVIAEPRKPENRFRAFLYGHLGELMDESLHFSEFLRRDFDGALADSGLNVIKRQRIRGDLAMIYVCEPLPAH